MDDLYQAAIIVVRNFRDEVGDKPFTEPYTRIYLAKLLQEQEDLIPNGRPVWADKHQDTFKALLGPHGFTIFKMLRIRSGVDKTGGRDSNNQ